MSEQVHVLCAEQLDAAQVARLRGVSDRLVVEARPVKTGAELEQVFTPQTEVLYADQVDFDPQRAPGLRWLQVPFAGVDNLQRLPIWQSSLQITSANGVHAIQIGEYVLMTILAHMHCLPQMQRLQWDKTWARAEQRAALMPTELRGAVLGIIGYGAIGREVARLGASFGMRILATQRTPEAQHFNGWTPQGTGDPDGSLPERYYPLTELHAFLQACDVVLLALPLTPTTRHIIGTSELAAMRPDALLVNIGRGGLIDQAALEEALAHKTLGGAALDVTDPEPLTPTSPLWSMPNVIITPHIAGMTQSYTERVLDLFTENLRRYLDGQPLLNVVERQLGY
ncbi:MAG: D-2-hydroxyacid dehydrogenase [Herpetosiphonaceae bacterium]|nr:D-2-hydroxyacid dehydrogenase [Herpetosiphonaceae bacterium]